MKLNIYKGKEVIKTYESDVEFLTLGVTEAVLKRLDIEAILSQFDLKALSKGKFDEILFGIKLAKVIVENFDCFKVILKEVFEGITDEELSKTKTTEVVVILKEILISSLDSLFNIEGINDEKN